MPAQYLHKDVYCLSNTQLNAAVLPAAALTVNLAQYTNSAHLRHPSKHVHLNSPC